MYISQGCLNLSVSFMVFLSFLVPLVDNGIPLVQGGRFLFILNEFSSFTGSLFLFHYVWNLPSVADVRIF